MDDPMTTEKRVGLYLRVSTDEQTIENQRCVLSEVAERKGWLIVAEFVDEGISGAKGRDERPAFDRLHRAIIRREVDVVAAWSVDRLGRSLQDLVAFLSELHAAGVDLYLDRQGLDTSTPAGRAMFQMLGVFAEFERAILVERTNAGIARARVYGTRSGKPIGRPMVDARKEAAIRSALASGKGILKTARECGVGSSVVQRIKATIPQSG
jgi:DNA invertase Pin-like site-specific DNA recombinase